MAEIIRQTQLTEHTKLEIVSGDITEEQVDAIVNAADEHLNHGGGVARAIVVAGGQVVQDESDAWVRQHGPVSHDSTAYTSAGNLSSRYIIHAVGPRWGEGDEDAKLDSAVRSSLAMAEKLELESIAIPAISTGIFGFPKARGAQVILQAVKSYFDAHPDSGLHTIRITLYDQPTIQAFTQSWDQLHPTDT
jgi:O-acetyl-ADP-ribose deacetylase (regulator of RNase III)